MSAAPVLEAPELPESATAATKFQKERASFRKLLPTLIPTYRGQFVAIHEGRVVGHGPTLTDVAMNAYAAFGYVPIYVELVDEAPPEPIRVPSPRQLQHWNGE